MIKVGQLLKFLNEINPQTTPIRLALFNYLKSFHELDEVLTPQIFEEFFKLCLDDPHWLRSKAQLGQETRLLLKNFNDFFQGRFDINSLRFPETVQVIEIENNSDLHDAAASYGARLVAEGEQYRLINDQNKRILILILRKDQSLEVRPVDRKFTLRKGFLEPLRNNFALFYTPQLELSPNHVHSFEVAPNMVTQFEIQGDRLFGVISRGYVFQKFQAFQGEKLHEISRLFWPLKRLEQFFVNRSSDPFYTEIAQKLEKIKLHWPINDPQWMQVLPVLLNQADMALEHIYIGDNRLESLIKDVKKITSIEASEKCLKISPKNPLAGPSDLTN